MEHTHDLSIDLETFSSVDIKKSGLYAYVDSPDFEILLFAYSLDGGLVQVVDMARGEPLPDWIIGALYSESYIKHAYNASFEMACLSKRFGLIGPMDPSQWRCTLFLGLFAGYPGSLKAIGEALGLGEDKKKQATGTALIRYFCVPCKPTKANGGRTRNMPDDSPEKWEQFIEYNRQDVVTEMAVAKALSRFQVPEWLQKQWAVDLKIHRRGVAVDRDLVAGALAIRDEEALELLEDAKQITQLDNPNSLQQMSGWLASQGIEAPSLTKDVVAGLLADPEVQGPARRVLEIRQELGKTSTKKYDAIAACICADGRVHGLLQFYGAARTGRWAGRLLQVQNLPRTYTKDIEYARRLVKERNGAALRFIYGSVHDTLSQLIRTALVASPGRVLVDADFSAIEARVISWVAGEEWRLKAFREGQDIYCASASQMFGVPVEKHGPNGHLRQKGKIAELALGYQGSANAMIAMGALDMGLSEEELPEIVRQWRDANPRIRQLWYDMQSAAEKVITCPGYAMVGRYIMLSMEHNPDTGLNYLVMTLPSSRKLYYPDPQIGLNRFGGASITYMGVGATRKWERLETYGGKLVENAVQAIARDCLAYNIDKLDAKGYEIVFHVHDEVVIDYAPTPEKDGQAALQEVIGIMSSPIWWAPGLPLDAAGWVGDFFTKD